jgi:hypothetical protein
MSLAVAAVLVEAGIVPNADTAVDHEMGMVTHSACLFST